MSSFRVRYQTIEFDHIDIHLRTLRDKQQYDDPEGMAAALGIFAGTWSLFGVVWPSSQVLAHLLLHYDIRNKRILEVGCGIALTSLMLNARLADITATDYHPEVEDFLLQNTRLNKGPHIPFFRADWADNKNSEGLFDLIIGSDLLYEGDHVECLANFINKHAKPSCEIILIDPGRSYHGRFSKKMISLGYLHTQSKPSTTHYLDTPFKGNILKYHR